MFMIFTHFPSVFPVFFVPHSFIRIASGRIIASHRTTSGPIRTAGRDDGFRAVAADLLDGAVLRPDPHYVPDPGAKRRLAVKQKGPTPKRHFSICRMVHR